MLVFVRLYQVYPLLVIVHVPLNPLGFTSVQQRFQQGRCHLIESGQVGNYNNIMRFFYVMEVYTCDKKFTSVETARHSPVSTSQRFA